jgi:N-acetylmuramoyl-L-alanine amidase
MIYVVLRDGGHGEETPGKRTPKISSLGRSIKETEFNEPVSYLFGEEMKRHGVIVHDVSAGTRDVPLTQRTNEANRLLNHYINKYGAANVRIVLVSFHFNAFDGSFEGSNPSGISVHIQPGSTHARRLAECVGKHLRQGTKQVYRGIVEQNLHMTREFQGVGILTENGFMDHPEEYKLMLDKNFQKEVARETAAGVLEYFGLQYKAEVEDGWKKDGNKWFFYENGSLKKSDWVKYKNLWYYLKDNGEMAAAEWIKWKNKWYYLKDDGAMKTGFVEYKGKWYFLEGSGAMVESTEVKVKVDKDGALIL